MCLKNKNLILTLFKCLILSSFIFVANANEFEGENETSFSYVVGAENGPQNWGNLNFPKWTLCGNGTTQSPINILDHSVVVLPSLGVLNTNYKPAPAIIKSRSHDIEVEWRGDAGGITINGTGYKLEQCHWHIPSEHTINGVRFNMELHIVHRSSEGDIAVVGILYNLGSPDSFLARLFPYLQTVGCQGTDVGILDPSGIGFASREYYRYNGSLTTPACSENVTWTIFKTVRTVSIQQITALRNAVHDATALVTLFRTPHRMIIFRCSKIPQQWRYFAEHRPLYIVPFLQCSFYSQVAQLCRDEHTSEEVLPSSAPQFDSHLYAGILQQLIKNNDATRGKILHCQILKKGNCLDLFARNILLNLYLKTGHFSDGLNLFDEMPDRNVVSCVTVIQGFSQLGEYNKAVDLFVRLHKEGHELNPFVFTTILKLLVSMGWAEMVWPIHACAHKLGHDSNAFVGTAIVDAYSVFGFANVAKEVFKGIVEKDMVCWTGMVSCYAENDCFEDALDLFNQMRIEGLLPNNFTFASAIKACLGLKAVHVGKSVHACILKTCYAMDPYVGVSLLDLYTRSGDIDDARQVFEEIPKDDVVPWSFMIARYSQNDRCEEALDLFSQMRMALVSPNQFTLASVLQACATMENLELGRQIHCHMVKVGLDENVFAFNALMDVYAKCGKMEASMNLFEEFENKNEVSWNTMIVGYVQLGDTEKAFLLFLNMCDEQVKATDVTYSSLLRASACLAALEAGTQIHTMAVKTMYDGDDAVSNALIDMYAKCGRINDARVVFDTMSKLDVVSWNSMVSAYSMHGLSADALKIFESMRKSDIEPNELTFVAVLSACSNTGSLEKGQSYFTSMKEDYGIKPCMEHYTCMVSLLGRLGHLEKAVRMIEDIPNEPSVMVWRALLGACVAHNNVELGRFAAEHVLEMEPQDESTYVLLSNIYATAKRWDSVAVVRKSMKRKRVKKEPGLSWIEHQGLVHYFAVGDESHEDIKLIRGMLEWLNLRSKVAGYEANHDAVLLDVEEDEKARLLWLHSERTALAFALVRMPRGSPIRIIKNLRICADCHVAIKFVSKLVQREIVVRDINRFHHFRDGVCSCNDYW